MTIGAFPLQIRLCLCLIYKADEIDLDLESAQLIYVTV